MTESSVLKRIVTHLRFPFSFFLLPIFVFALIHSTPWLESPLWLFIALHLLAYPSSNGYNSLQDRDTESIGGIEHPEKVPKQMLGVSIALDFLAILITTFVYHPITALLLLAYIVASRAYSYRGIRLKKYPIIGFLTVIVFQGAAVFLLTTTAITGQFHLGLSEIIGMAVSAVMIGASYPLTQVYQHEQDSADGVKTISAILGVKGTFTFAIVGMLLFNALIFAYFIMVVGSWRWMLLFLVVSAPAGAFLSSWAQKTWKNRDQANFKNAMQMSIRGSLCMNLFFFIWLVLELTAIQLPL